MIWDLVTRVYGLVWGSGFGVSGASLYVKDQGTRELSVPPQEGFAP